MTKGRESEEGEGELASSPCELDDLMTQTIYLLSFDGFYFSETFDLRDLPLSPTQCEIQINACKDTEVYAQAQLTLLVPSLGLVLAAPSPPDLFLSSPGLSLLRERRFDEASASFSLPDLSVSTCHIDLHIHSCSLPSLMVSCRSNQLDDPSHMATITYMY